MRKGTNGYNYLCPPPGLFHTPFSFHGVLACAPGVGLPPSGVRVESFRGATSKQTACMYLKLDWFVLVSRDGGFLPLERFSRLFTHASAWYGLHARLHESMQSTHRGEHVIPCS